MFGLTEDDMMGVIGDCVREQMDDLVVITEYNPAIEKHKTGGLIISLFKQLLNQWLLQAY